MIFFHQYNMDYFGLKSLEEIGNFIRAQINSISNGEQFNVLFEIDNNEIKCTPEDAPHAYYHFKDNKIYELIEKYGKLKGFVSDLSKNSFTFDIDVNAAIRNKMFSNIYKNDSCFNPLNGNKRFNIANVEHDIFVVFDNAYGQEQRYPFKNGKIIINLQIDVEDNPHIVKYMKPGYEITFEFRDFTWKTKGVYAELLNSDIAYINKDLEPLIKMCYNEENMAHAELLSYTGDAIVVGLMIRCNNIKHGKYDKTCNFRFEERVLPKNEYTFKKRTLTPQEFASLYYYDYDNSVIRDLYDENTYGIDRDCEISELLSCPLGDESVYFNSCSAEDICEWMKDKGEVNIIEDRLDYFDAYVEIKERTSLNGIYLASFGYKSDKDCYEISYHYGIIHDRSSTSQYTSIDQYIANRANDEYDAMEYIDEIVNQLAEYDIFIDLEYVDLGEGHISYYEGSCKNADDEYEVISRQFPGLTTLELKYKKNR